MRRIVQYPSSTALSDVNISPQWHQWLRHTRREAPSLAEQSQDLVRQANLKALAAQADARWAAKPSFLDTPRQGREVGEVRAPPALAGMERGESGKVNARGTSGNTAEGVVMELGEGEGLQDAKEEEILVKGWDGKGRVHAQASAPHPAIEDKDTPKNIDEEIEMPAPDHKNRYFNERLEGGRAKEKKYKEDPWKQARGAPSEEWQPQAWSPNAAATRR